MPNADLRDKLAVAKAAPAEGRDMLTLVKDLAPQFELATRGTPVDHDRFLRICLTELRMNPDLQACTPASVFGGLMLSAQLGLEIGSALGQSWLVPFNVKDKRSGRAHKEATWMLGYKGIVALAGRGDVHIMGRAVHEADEFDYEIVDGRDVLHHRRELRKDRGPAWLWYATAHWGEKGYTAIVLNRSEVELYRARSRAKDSGPWTTDYNAMAIKTCVRRLAPWIPMTPQTADALAVDSQVVRGTEIDLGELAAEARVSAPDAIEAGEVEEQQPASGADEPGEGEQPAPDDKAAKS